MHHAFSFISLLHSKKPPASPHPVQLRNYKSVFMFTGFED